MRALYISHNGMLESLGQAQVLPYLRGLARRGVEFDLFSFELPSARDAEIEALRSELSTNRIRWTPLRRARDSRLRTKVLESAGGVFQAFMTALQKRPQIVHGRSYLPTAIADMVASTVPRARLVFDCRGMLGDEYVDAGYWTTNRLEYRLLKRYEHRAFRRSEGIVVLTERLREIVLERGWVGSDSTIEAIPCCVDMTRFTFDRQARQEVRGELGLTEGSIIVVYSGSLGGWYEEADLASFVALLQQRDPARRVVLLVLTQSDSSNLRKHLLAEGVLEQDIIIRRVAPSEMPRYLSAGDLALSFIKSCFSKLGSSPTKVAEYLACGLPVVLNGDIGDQAKLAIHPDSCVVLESLTSQALRGAVDAALALASRPVEERAAAALRVALERYSLEDVGVARYERLYQRLASL